MSAIPFKEENPKGLHKRYYIQKFKGKRLVEYDFFGNPKYDPVFEPVDVNAEYFVLRLDKDGDDLIHVQACRDAIITYALAIKNHLPELSKDLIQRYSAKVKY